MAKRFISINGDVSAAKEVTETLKRLQIEFNTNRHLNQVTKGAFEVLSERFNQDTAGVALATPENFHHMYEWGNIGNPMFQLWNNKLGGSGGNRIVSFDFRASRQTVPTEVDALGNPKFPEGFDTSKLKRIHVFVWKAPVMEYGLQVTVIPKLSPKKMLVFPNHNEVVNADRDARAPRDVVFTPHSYSFVPGKEVAGRFTAWFIEWWTNGWADRVVKSQFEPLRDNAFKRAFERRVGPYRGAGVSSKKASFKIDTQAAAQGKRMAQLIAGDLEQNYIEMARRRRGNG